RTSHRIECGGGFGQAGISFHPKRSSAAITAESQTFLNFTSLSRRDGRYTITRNLPVSSSSLPGEWKGVKGFIVRRIGKPLSKSRNDQNESAVDFEKAMED